MTADVGPLGDLAAFAGHWTGTGTGHYPTIADFAYEEEITFTPSGRPFLTYHSRTWSPGRTKPMHTENGYLRRTGSGAVELLISQPTGFTELHRGELVDGVLELELVNLGASPEAKPVHATRRRLTVAEEVVGYDMWMSHADTPMTHHLTAELRRAAG
ncbi:FABP family protein [Tomitella biformata]|uniref:FABP family protein n=1 Tax=Tomitella biformata TaxID=630403 RepID=UPI000467E823|nr:FABP family protein [Tomitella biformata]